MSDNAMKEVRYIWAINQALSEEMERDEAVFVMGEDIGAMGGTFQVTKGLFEQFGEERVRDTPISELGFVGCGVGAAIAGMRPIIELQFFDFVMLARSFGALGVRVDDPAGIEPAIREALSAPQPTVIHVPIVRGNPAH